MSVHELFGRSVTVLIGPNKATGKLITKLRVTFKIEKNLEKHPNPATIVIYNCSETTRGIIEQKNSQIILSAGYGDPDVDAMPVLFRGTVAKVTTKKVGPDTLTEIEAGDGNFAFGNSTINMAFAPGSKTSQILSSVQSALGLSPGQQIGVNGSVEFTHGLTLSGMTKDALTTVLGKQGLDWSIQDEQLQILPPDKSTSQEVVVLNSGWSEENPVNTGLIGSPFRTKVLDPALAKPTDGKVAQNGIKLISLLNADIKPGRRIQVDSEFVQGTFTCQKVVFNGDTHSAVWYSEVEAR